MIQNERKTLFWQNKAPRPKLCSYDGKRATYRSELRCGIAPHYDQNLKRNPKIKRRIWPSINLLMPFVIRYFGIGYIRMILRYFVIKSTQLLFRIYFLICKVTEVIKDLLVVSNYWLLIILCKDIWEWPICHLPKTVDKGNKTPHWSDESQVSKHKISALHVYFILHVY